jgi:hypothetical protein
MRGDSERRLMALEVIGGAYLPSLEAWGLRDAKRVVDRILDRHDDGPVMTRVGQGNPLLGLLVRRDLGVAVRNDTWKVWWPQCNMRLRKLPAGRAGV